MFSPHRSGFIFLLFLLFSFLLSACDTDHYAPVSDLSVIEQIPQKGYHQVLPGETLYEIAWRYGLDYRYLAWRNQIKPPYFIQQRQIIYLRGKPKLIIKNNINIINNKIITKNIHKNNQLNIIPFSPAHWVWPVKTRDNIQSFSLLNKGINIFGFKGDSIYAAASGKVVYAGNGLRRYGNLIIIKHNNQYLSAYAHHSMMYVKDGDWVRQGQKIAEMGNTGSNRTMLHFEVRVAGKPVNPLVLLPR